MSFFEAIIVALIVVLSVIAIIWLLIRTIQTEKIISFKEAITFLEEKAEKEKRFLSYDN